MKTMRYDRLNTTDLKRRMRELGLYPIHAYRDGLPGASGKAGFLAPPDACTSSRTRLNYILIERAHFLTFPQSSSVSV